MSVIIGRNDVIAVTTRESLIDGVPTAMLRRFFITYRVYTGIGVIGASAPTSCIDLVEQKGIEPSTSALRTRRSPS